MFRAKRVRCYNDDGPGRTLKKSRPCGNHAAEREVNAGAKPLPVGRPCLTRRWDLSVCVSSLPQGVGNTGTLWAETGDAWSTQGSWDPTLSGKALVCIYDRDDYSNEACSEVRRHVKRRTSLSPRLLQRMAHVDQILRFASDFLYFTDNSSRSHLAKPWRKSRSPEAR